MTVLAAVAFAPLFLENDDLFSAALIDDLTGNFTIGYQWGANLGIAFTADKQNIGQGNRRADLPIELFDLDDLAFGHAVLLAAGSNYCIFHRIFSERKFLMEFLAKVNLWLSSQVRATPKMANRSPSNVNR
jgi:hypothetical protein